METPQHIHVIGAGGIITSGLMAVLQARFPKVTGSDENILPPADRILREDGVCVTDGFARENIAGTVDLAVLNAFVPRGNPEWEAVLERRIPFTTWPALLPTLGLLAPHNGVVAGTNGKTTTACMWQWIMDRTGRTCDFVIGGEVPGASGGVRLAGRAHCILEGDEYPCGPGDRNPKFLHYRPEVAVITNIHFDHPDAFHSEAEVVACFTRLRDILPPDGLLIYNRDDKHCVSVAAGARCETAGFGFSKNASPRLTNVRRAGSRTRFEMQGARFSIPQLGRMNAANAAAAALAAAHWGVALVESAAALENFPGAGDRQTVLRDDGTMVAISDTAYHPEAVSSLLDGLRHRYPGRRLGLMLQPRHTHGEGNWQQRQWPRRLARADLAILTDALNPGTAVNHFSSERAAREANRAGGRVRWAGSPESAGEFFAREAAPGDVWAICLAPWFAQPRGQVADTVRDFPI